MGLGLGQIDHIIRLITISVITLSGFHCSRNIINIYCVVVVQVYVYFIDSQCFAGKSLFLKVDHFDS